MQQLILTKKDASYNDWLKAVDEILMETVFMTHIDLPDFHSRALYNAGSTAKDAAMDCLTESDLPWSMIEEIFDEL